MIKKALDSIGYDFGRGFGDLWGGLPFHGRWKSEPHEPFLEVESGLFDCFA